MANEVKTLKWNAQIPPEALTNYSKILITAGATLSANKVVRPDAAGKMIYADKDTLADMYKIVGITITSIIEDATGYIIIEGQVDNDTWSWTIGNPIYLGNTGDLTQTVPTTGFLMVVGRAVSGTKIIWAPESPIELI